MNLNKGKTFPFASESKATASILQLKKNLETVLQHQFIAQTHFFCNCELYYKFQNVLKHS